MPTTGFCRVRREKSAGSTNARRFVGKRAFDASGTTVRFASWFSRTTTLLLQETNYLVSKKTTADGIYVSTPVKIGTFHAQRKGCAYLSDAFSNGLFEAGGVFFATHRPRLSARP
jgi:hypothetical protein